MLVMVLGKLCPIDFKRNLVHVNDNQVILVVCLVGVSFSLTGMYLYVLLLVLESEECEI